MGNRKTSEKKDSWLKVLLGYTEGSGQRLGISVVLSVISIISGLMPYYCMQSLTMLVSAKTNSSVIAVIVPFILIFLPSFLSGTSLPLLNKILGLLPDQMLQMNQVVKFFNLYEIGGKVFCAVPILIISYSILLLLIVPVIYFIYRRKEVYN